MACKQTMCVRQDHSVRTDHVCSSRPWRTQRLCVFVRTMAYTQTMCVRQDHGVRTDHVFVNTMASIQTMCVRQDHGVRTDHVCSSRPWHTQRPCCSSDPLRPHAEYFAQFKFQIHSYGLTTAEEPPDHLLQ